MLANVTIRDASGENAAESYYRSEIIVANSFLNHILLTYTFFFLFDYFPFRDTISKTIFKTRNFSREINFQFISFNSPIFADRVTLSNLARQRPRWSKIGSKRREKCVFVDTVIHFGSHYLHTSLPPCVLTLSARDAQVQKLQ